MMVHKCRQFYPDSCVTRQVASPQSRLQTIQTTNTLDAIILQLPLLTLLYATSNN